MAPKAKPKTKAKPSEVAPKGKAKAKATPSEEPQAKRAKTSASIETSDDTEYGDGRIAGHEVFFGGKFKELKKKDAQLLALASGAHKVVDRWSKATLVVEGENALDRHLKGIFKQVIMTEAEFKASVGDLSVAQAAAMSQSAKAKAKARAVKGKRIVFAIDKSNAGLLANFSESIKTWESAVKAAGGIVQSDFSSDTDIVVNVHGVFHGEDNAYVQNMNSAEPKPTWDLDHFKKVMSCYP